MDLAEFPYVIELNQLCKTFGTLSVLSGIDLKVMEGEKIALMGPSGCGKSTLLRCLNGLDMADGGTANVLGVSVVKENSHRPIDLTRLRAQIGTVFQQYNLFPHMSVLENIILGPVQVNRMGKAEAIEMAHSLLAQVGLPEKADVFPEQLSGGQKQRVALARSLAMQPKILLLDEPTSALDPPMTREVLKVLADTTQDQMTVIMVTHEVHFAQDFSDRILMLYEGKIVDEGPPEQVIRFPQHPVSEAYFEHLR